MHRVIQTDRKLAVIAKPPVGTAAFIRMLPRAVNNLCVGDRCPIFNETRSLGTNLKIVISDGPKAATTLYKNEVGKEKEDRSLSAIAGGVTLLRRTFGRLYARPQLFG